MVDGLKVNTHGSCGALANTHFHRDTLNRTAQNTRDVDVSVGETATHINRGTGVSGRLGSGMR